MTPVLTNTPEATLVLRTAARITSPPAATGTADAFRESRTLALTSRPSATPHYYTVTAEDTLESIAARFGITVAALRAANADLPPDMLQPGQILFIPRPTSASMTGTFVRFLATNTPLPLLLEPPDCYPTPADELICLGWLENTSLLDWHEVLVQVTLLGSDAAPTVQRTAPLVQRTVPAGMGAPYALRFNEQPEYATVRAEVLSASTSAPTGASAMPLQLLDSQHELEDSLVWVRGTFVHAGDEPLAEVLVVAALFDDRSRVIAYRVDHWDEPLAPGEQLPLELLLTPLEPGTTQHWLYAEGYTAPPES